MRGDACVLPGCGVRKRRLWESVIASGAKQSRATRDALDCFVALRAPRNDEYHSGLMPAKAITLAHFSVCSARNLPNSAGLIAKGTPPRSAKRSCILASAKPALISALSVVTI